MSETQLASVNGVTLAYQTYGTGDPLVLLHGGYGTWEMFGPNLEALAAGRQVIGVDLQSHGRTPVIDRPMRFETMADDINALIEQLGFERANVMGFSLGGGVALRAAIQHPERIARAVLVSTPFKHYGWHPEMAAAMDQMGPELAEPLKQTPMYQEYVRVAPRPDDWPILVSQLTDLIKRDYDWSADVAKLTVPTMVVIGDHDGLPPRHAVEFFELLGAGKRDAGWDRSGMTPHRLAILPGVTHYDIHVSPQLARSVASFLDDGLA